MAQVPLGSKKLPGRRVKFELTSDPWVELKLEDGTELRLKTIVADVFKLEKANTDGDPTYVVKSQTIVVTRLPEHEGEVEEVAAPAPQKKSPRAKSTKSPTRNESVRRPPRKRTSKTSKASRGGRK